MATSVRLEENDQNDDPEAELLPAFEKKYKEQMRQIVTQKLDLPISTLPTMLKVTTWSPWPTAASARLNGDA